jgi:BMFP domain-containing protein YqiC
LPISDKDKVSVYHLIVRVGFNIGELATRLRADNRTKRLEWVSEKLSKNAPISARSCRRHLDDAIRQIARQLITGGMPAPDVPLSADDQVIVKSTESFIARFPLAHLLQMSGELEYAVNRARDSCESAKRAVYTFDVLLALLEMPSGRARACLDEVESGLSDEVVQGLRAMPDPMKPARPFYPFKWHKREEMALAWQYALAKTRREATELDVMLAILDGSSETNLWLQRYPLQESHAQVRAVVAQRGSEPIDPGISPVPD